MGTLFRVATWGESHGAAIGAVVDGCPAGLSLSEADIQPELDKRRPGYDGFTSKRREPDEVSILSGVRGGFTTGAPISLIIKNIDANPAEYTALSGIFRPGHADYTYYKKYGIIEPGGGRASGRETAARVAAGAIAKKILAELGISVETKVKAIGGLEAGYESLLENCAARNDSIGGLVECKITGLKAGIGEPVFSKLDAEISKAVMSIGGVKGIEFGAGFKAAEMYGSENNDEFFADGNGVAKISNNSGGVLGGISDGSDIIFRVAVKPPPSIGIPQKTVNLQGESTEIRINGRHDPVIVFRAAPVISAMAAIILTDLVFMSVLSRMDNIAKIYKGDN